MQTDWKDKIEKVQLLMQDGPESRQMALSLLDALVDTIRDLGMQHLLSPIFEGMRIEKDYLSLPSIMLNALNKEKNKIQRTYRWSRDYSQLKDLLEEDLAWPLWELFFRAFPEKIQDLPEFLILEGVRRIPSFCNAESPVKALGFSHPMYGFNGLDKCTHLKRIHFYHRPLPFIRSGYRKFYHTLMKDRRFDPKPYEEVVQEGVDISLGLSNVEHLFAFNIHLKNVEKDVHHLISTNLHVDINRNASNIQYATNPLKNPLMPRLETASMTDGTEQFFVTDPIGLTNGRLSDHPKLIQSARFLESSESYHELLNSNTDSNVLEHLEIVSTSRQTVAKHRIRFLLNDSVDKSIRERIEIIEMDNPTQELIQRIWSEGLILTSLRELHIAHNVKNNFVLDKQFLHSFPSLKIIDIVRKGYGYATSPLVIGTDFWGADSAGHPLCWVQNSLSYLKQALGFRKLDGQQTLEERVIFFQADFDVAIKHLNNLKHVQYMRLQQSTNLAPVHANAVHMKSLLAEHNSESDLEKVLKEENAWVEKTVYDKTAIHSEANRSTLLKYRPTVMAPITDIRDVDLFFERQQVCQRETLNRRIPLSKSASDYINEHFYTDDTAVKALFESLNPNGFYRFGRFSYYGTQGEWNRTTYQTIDGEYEKAVLNGKVRTYNLDRAFMKRYFDGQLISSTQLRYNTTKVPIAALKTIDNLSVLKIERHLSAAEWDVVSQMTNVEELYIVGQNLKVLPEVICQMSNLKKLFLWGNNITSLPAEFSRLVNLETLSLKGNQAAETETEMLTSMPALAVIYK